MTVAPLMPWVADALVVLGAVVTTLGVYGTFRMPGVFMKLHAASKSVFLGVCSFLIAMVATGDPAFIARAALIAMLLVLTTPVAAHEIGRAATRDQARHAPIPDTAVSDGPSDRAPRRPRFVLTGDERP